MGGRCERPRGFALDDADHRADERAGLSRAVRHERVQFLCGDVAGALMVGLDAGERRGGEFAQKIVVVHSKNGNLSRNGNAVLFTDIGDLYRTRVVIGHHGGRFGK